MIEKNAEEVELLFSVDVTGKLYFWMNLRMTLSVCEQEYQLLIQFFICAPFTIHRNLYIERRTCWSFLEIHVNR